MTAVKIALAILLIYSAKATAQLQYSAPSVDAQGMGGVEASLPSDNAVAQLANPAQTGFFSLHGIFNAAAYVPTSSYFKQAGNGSYRGSIFSSATEIGVDLQKYLKTPYEISAGIGYARTGVNESGGFEIDGPDITNRANNLTVGVGFSDVVRAGVGLGINWISSRESALIPSTLQHIAGNIVAQSYGAMVQVPVAEIIRGNGARDCAGRLRPIADITVAYAMKDFGGYLYYNSSPQPSGMLFRQADLGINLDLGFESTFDGQPWKILSVTIAREADEPLLCPDSTLAVYTVGTNQPDSVYTYTNVYTNSPRYFNPYANFISGSSQGKVGIRTGGQVQFAEFLYVRLGATAGPYIGGTSTYGYGLRLKGLLRLLAVLQLTPHAQDSFLSFLMKHVDLRYDYARISYAGAGGQSFNELGLELQ